MRSEASDFNPLPGGAGRLNPKIFLNEPQATSINCLRNFYAAGYGGRSNSVDLMNSSNNTNVFLEKYIAGETVQRYLSDSAGSGIADLPNHVKAHWVCGSLAQDSSDFPGCAQSLRPA